MATRISRGNPVRKKTRRTPRRTPIQQRSTATVDAILEAAIQILTRDGHAGLTTNAIAERAGISVGSLYQYFTDKQAVIDALLARHAARVQPLIAAAVEATQGRPMLEAIDAVVDALVAAEAADLRMAQIFHQLLPASPNSPIDAFEAGIEQLVADRFARAPGVRPRDPVLAAILLVRATSGALRSTARRTPELLESPAFARELAAMIRAYLQTCMT